MGKHAFLAQSLLVFTTPKTDQDASWIAQRRPKRPRGLSDDQRGPQHRSKSPQDGPRGLQDSPNMESRGGIQTDISSLRPKTAA
eukprot:8605289-Pyramimonas_sp.AAC.1